MIPFNGFFAVLVIVVLCGGSKILFVDAFSSRKTSPSLGKSSKLFGIADWRDDIGGHGYSSKRRVLRGDGKEREVVSALFEKPDSASETLSNERCVPLLLVPSDQVVLQGETKYFHFVHDDELRLFQQSIDRHHGIFALGLISTDDGEEVLLDRLPLLDITNYRYMDVDMGIICGAQVVGRASLASVEVESDAENQEQLKWGMATAVCTEYFDEREEYYTLQEANEMAQRVVKLVFDVSQIEKKLTMATTDDVNDQDEENDPDETRQGRLCNAILAAYESDSQGYHVHHQDSGSSHLRSWKELNAVSWAAFSSSVNHKVEETYRLHALDMSSTTNRLKFAGFWLSDILLEVQQQLQELMAEP